MERPREYKWSSKSIEEEFKLYNETVNYNKVYKFQKHTDDLEECIEWCVNSARNDREQKQRRLSHGTGAE